MKLPVYVHPRVQTFLDENASWWAKHHSAEQAELWYDGVGNKPTHRALFTIRPDRVYVLLLRHATQASVTPDDLV